MSACGYDVHVGRLIHMNGRVYDPVLARFISPDPLVQAPTYSQSWNRYSYVFNNPLKYTDPSGYSAESNCTTERSEQKEKTTCTTTDDSDSEVEEITVIGYANGSSGSRDSGAIQVDKGFLDQTRGGLSDSAPFGPNNTNFTPVPFMVAPANLASDDPRLTVMSVAPATLSTKITAKMKKIQIDGPRPNKDGKTGMIMQIRYGGKPVFRIEVHPIDPVNRTPKAHYHIAPNMKEHRDLPPIISRYVDGYFK